MDLGIFLAYSGIMQTKIQKESTHLTASINININNVNKLKYSLYII